MPVLKHAKKKLRQDKKRTLKNKHLRNIYKRAIKIAKAKPTDKNISAAFSEIDKVAKHHIIHQNKAARLKSSLTKSLSTPKKETTPAVKAVKVTKAVKKPKAKTSKPAKKK